MSGDTYRLGVDLRELDEHSVHAYRLLLTADVLRRSVEALQGCRVLLVVVTRSASSTPAGGPALREPTARATSPDEAVAVLGSPPDLVLEPARPGPDESQGRASSIMRIGAVRSLARTDDTLAGVLGKHDSAALRLALLRFSPARPASLSAARLRRAEETLGRWRYKVAMWADMPPGLADEGLMNAARDALGTDVDTVTVLTHLHRLEIDPHTASGRKFATFAYVDQLLGLDLARLVGRLRR
jgi:hypothetical protein